MECNSCGATAAAGAKFCAACGSALNEGSGWLPPGAATPTGKIIDKAPPAREPEPAPVAARPASPSTQPKREDLAGTGCALALLLGIGYALLSWCSGPEKTPEQLAAEQAQIEAKRVADENSGFHCLSGWDGSNASLVAQIKDQLRDPGSFEHDETRITPEDDGKHMVMMRYRARNGFGGMNVATAMATVDHRSCNATIISTGD